MLNRLSLAALVTLTTACGVSQESAGPTVREHKVVELDTSQLTRVQLDMGAGELEVRGGAATLVDADFTYNVPEWKPTVERTVSGTRADVRITQGGSAISMGRTENRWQLALNDTMPMEVVAHLGAGEATLTLGSLNLRRVELHVGAGEADIDLRGTPASSYRVEIEGGVGEATVRVPANVAIAATASGIIGDINVEGLEKRDGKWVNPRATSSPITIELDVNGGIGEIRIIAG